MNISKYIIVAICLSSSLVVSGQANLNNGRSISSTPSNTQEVAKKMSSDQKEMNQVHDFDDPNAQNNVKDESWTYPIDLDQMKANLKDASGTEDLSNKVDVLSDQIYDLILFNEQLRLENQDIKKSMEQCCKSSTKSTLSFLLQNAPNPFREETKINYFIEGASNSATIEVRSIDGQKIASYPLEKSGYGTINLEANDLKPGYYVYTLFSNNEVIDSKVLVLVD